MQPEKRRVIAVVGPTGAGKTVLAVTLAKKFNGVLISADSRQVYRGLDIGTNKEGGSGSWQHHPARFIDGVPQLLIDIIEPGRRFTLNDWLDQARIMLIEIWQAGQLPIVVGGTGLYVTALLEGYQPGAGRGSQSKQSVDFDFLILEIDKPRGELNKKSDERCLKIFDTLITETQTLITCGIDPHWLAKIGLDYRAATNLISGQGDRLQTIAEFQKQSRAYIRRQLTWWRHHGKPVRVADCENAEVTATKFLKS